MAQKTINVGSVANDGTGDTIRGAFTNVNANFTEVYSNVTAIIPAYTTANVAFSTVNTVNSMVQSVAISANNYSNSIGSASNAYAVVIGASSNAYTNTYTVSVGAAANSYATSVGTAGNNYASILAANNAVGANAWANTVTVNTYNWANTKFDTVVNTSLIYIMANGAYNRANASVANAAGTIQGNIFFTGTVTTAVGFTDSLGPIREKRANTVNSNVSVLVSESIVISNSTNTIHIKIPNDGDFIFPSNIGSTIEIYQYGTGTTKIVANDAAVTVLSSNNWANIAGQYLTASVVKVLPNTWILTGNLKT